MKKLMLIRRQKSLTMSIEKNKNDSIEQLRAELTLLEALPCASESQRLFYEQAKQLADRYVSVGE